MHSASTSSSLSSDAVTTQLGNSTSALEPTPRSTDYTEDETDDN